jgi:hypothetical protein
VRELGGAFDAVSDTASLQDQVRHHQRWVHIGNRNTEPFANPRRNFTPSVEQRAIADWIHRRGEPSRTAIAGYVPSHRLAALTETIGDIGQSHQVLVQHSDGFQAHRLEVADSGGDRLREIVRLPIELCDWNASLYTEDRIVGAFGEKLVKFFVGRPVT